MGELVLGKQRVQTCRELRQEGIHHVRWLQSLAIVSGGWYWAAVQDKKYRRVSHCLAPDSLKTLCGRWAPEDHEPYPDVDCVPADACRRCLRVCNGYEDWVERPNLSDDLLYLCYGSDWCEWYALVDDLMDLSDNDALTELYCSRW